MGIAPSANPVFAGESVTFTATPVNGGTSPAYQWMLNGSIIPVVAGPIYSFTPVNNDVVTCKLTSDISCASGNPAFSAPYTMTVNSVAATISLEDITIIGSDCFDATQTITVAGNGHTFTVPEGGYATMIAGQRILYLPGTSVISGGYMYGYITQDGHYCNYPTKVATVTGKDEVSAVIETVSYKAWPNPTTGSFRLELTGSGLAGTIRVEIFNMHGKRIVSREVTGSVIHEFSLSDNPAGIYLVRICGKTLNESIRLIKIQ